MFPPLTYWHGVRKRAIEKLKKIGAVTKPGVKPLKVAQPEELTYDERKALDMFLGQVGIRKTQDGYYLECEDERHC